MSSLLRLSAAESPWVKRWVVVGGEVVVRRANLPLSLLSNCISYCLLSRYSRISPSEQMFLVKQRLIFSSGLKLFFNCAAIGAVVSGECTVVVVVVASGC